MVYKGNIYLSKIHHAKNIREKVSKNRDYHFKGIMAASVKGNPKPRKANRQSKHLILIENIGLPIKLQILLKNNNVMTLKDLASYDAVKLLQFKNLGVKTIPKIENAISKYGLNLGSFDR